MKVKLVFKDKTVINPPNPTKRKLAGFIRGGVERNVIFEGSGTVDYGKGYITEFDFTSRSDLEHKLYPCLEEELINEFK